MMLWRSWFCAIALAIASLCRCAAAEDNLGLRAPEGFQVSLYAGDELAHDIYSMTIDSQGRVVVASHDYIKRLEDTDGDGRAVEPCCSRCCPRAVRMAWSSMAPT